MKKLSQLVRAWGSQKPSRKVFDAAKGEFGAYENLAREANNTGVSREVAEHLKAEDISMLHGASVPNKVLDFLDSLCRNTRDYSEKLMPYSYRHGNKTIRDFKKPTKVSEILDAVMNGEAPPYLTGEVSTFRSLLALHALRDEGEIQNFIYTDGVQREKLADDSIDSGTLDLFDHLATDTLIEMKPGKFLPIQFKSNGDDSESYVMQDLDKTLYNALKNKGINFHVNFTRRFQDPYVTLNRKVPSVLSLKDASTGRVYELIQSTLAKLQESPLLEFKKGLSELTKEDIILEYQNKGYLEFPSQDDLLKEKLKLPKSAAPSKKSNLDLELPKEIASRLKTVREDALTKKKTASGKALAFILKNNAAESEDKSFLENGLKLLFGQSRKQDILKLSKAYKRKKTKLGDHPLLNDLNSFYRHKVMLALTSLVDAGKIKNFVDFNFTEARNGKGSIEGKSTDLLVQLPDKKNYYPVKLLMHSAAVAPDLDTRVEELQTLVLNHDSSHQDVDSSHFGTVNLMKDRDLNIQELASKLNDEIQALAS